MYLVHSFFLATPLHPHILRNPAERAFWPCMSHEGPSLHQRRLFRAKRGGGGGEDQGGWVVGDFFGGTYTLSDPFALLPRERTCIQSKILSIHAMEMKQIKHDACIHSEGMTRTRTKPRMASWGGLPHALVVKQKTRCGVRESTKPHQIIIKLQHLGT